MAVSMTSGYPWPKTKTKVAKLPEGLIVLVQNAIAFAWQELLLEVSRNEFAICGQHEDVITERLQRILGKLFALDDAPVEGLSLLQSFNREGKLRNYNAAHLDKQPDLAFYPLRGYVPCSNAETCAVFVECKPIDSIHPVPSVYCHKGLVRFVNGDYAWSVDRALMVGYVRNNCHLPDGLESVLVKANMRTDMDLVGMPQVLHEEPRTSCGDAIWKSFHQRVFTLNGSTEPVGLICINHLWLHPQEPCERSRCQT